MQATPFHMYAKARELECLSNENTLLPAYASSDIEIYPYQIAAAGFALRSPYLKGCLLSDECSLGKTYEALLVATQKWYEGKSRQLLILPVNMVDQWIKKIETSFSIPYILIDTTAQWSAAETDNPFLQDALIITTYDFAVQKSEYIQAQKWDMVIFDEADYLNDAYKTEKKNVRILKQATEGAFRLLLTPTPIEMDIRDIYGLIYFINETILPADVDEFYKYYFRRPERYPELAAWVSQFCFRTLKSQVSDYVNFTNRIPYTVGCEMTEDEAALYDKVHAYFMLPNKIAFPDANSHDLMMNHCPKISSSPKAITEMFEGVLNRLRRCNHVEGLTEEIISVEEIVILGQSLSINGKMKVLLPIIKQCLEQLKKLKAPEKAIIFVNYRATLKTLKALLSEQGYTTLTYSGENSRDYSVMESFRSDPNMQILIATDDTSKGLDIEFCPVIVNYDMLTNAVKLDQRISRCHRQGQRSDVLVVNLFSRNNYADVRCLELINKRVLQFDGIFGMSDTVLGNFDEEIKSVLSDMRRTTDIQVSFDENLTRHESGNRPVVEQAEDILFTTFTKEIADKVKVSPKYITEKSSEINNDLWDIVAPHLAKNGYTINEAEKTAVLPDGVESPHLFYYWTGSRNKPYNGLKAYGAGNSFKPASGRVTLASPVGRGVLHNIECADEGTITVQGAYDCKIALYNVEVSANGEWSTCSVFAGKNNEGRILTDEECRAIMALPVIHYSTGERASASWLKSSVSFQKTTELDSLIEPEQFIEKFLQRQNLAQAEEIERMKLKNAAAKTGLERSLDELRTQVKKSQADASGATDRIKQMQAMKQLNVVGRDLREKEERIFFESMKLDTALEDEIKRLVDGTKPRLKIQRQFIITVTG